MHQIRFRPGLHWGSLERSPKPLSWFSGALLLRDRGRGGRGKRERRRGDEGTRGTALPIFAISWICPCFLLCFILSCRARARSLPFCARACVCVRGNGCLSQQQMTTSARCCQSKSRSIDFKSFAAWRLRRRFKCAV